MFAFEISTPGNNSPLLAINVSFEADRICTAATLVPFSECGRWC